MSDQQVTDKIVLVTGSTSGIGLGIAKKFAQAGAQVILNGIEDDPVFHSIIAELASIGKYPLDYYRCDVSDHEQISQMITHITNKYSRLDILVNNAGIQHTENIESFPKPIWDKVIAVNLSSVFYTTTAVLPLMQSNDYGRIINIASIHGLVASPEKSAYVAAKHGVVGLTKVTALENATSNITCNAICPGWVRTPLVETQIEARAHKEGVSSEIAVKNMLLKEPSQRFTSVEEIAEMAVFLCGPAGRNMTGTSLAMDGGWTAQ